MESLKDQFITQLKTVVFQPEHQITRSHHLFVDK